MLLERFYDDDLAQASYLIGCQQSGEAIVVDGRRDIDTYIATAKRNGMKIVAVTETHIHADYLSGTREVARATGAKLYVSGEGGQDWQYGFDAERLHDGDVITIGNVRIEARHTPGHTPEHLVFLITDGAYADTPGYLLSGDFVFAGDLGRPDLLDEAAGGQDTRFQGAMDMFASLRDVFLPLEDHVQVYPAHGAGSACGKSLGAIPATTVGYERRYAWWAPLVDRDRDAFVEQLLNGQPDAHAYFARMKRENRDGPALLPDMGPVPALSQDDAVQQVRRDEAIFVDTRTPDQVRSGTPEGALAIPAVGKTASWGAWVVDPDVEPRPLILLATDQEQADTVRDHLIRVGIDRYAGFVTSLDGFSLVTSEQVAPSNLDDVDDAFILDVRGRSEFEGGHVPGAVNVSAGRMLRDQDEIPMERPIVSYCQSGARNIVAAQALRRAGYDVRELDGSYLGWLRSTQPAEPAAAH
jgi:hydroxyacylglutathione hydrolase